MVIWSILCISTSLIVLVLTFSRNMPLVMARTIWAPGILWLAKAKTEVTGLEHIDKTKTYIIVSNHLSYLDIPTLFRILPLNLHFIGKHQLKRTPFIGWYMQATGMIFINRENKRAASKSLDEAALLIKNGKTVLIFPEGTVSDDKIIKRFKKGGFSLAMKAGVDILPISLKGTSDVWPTDTNTKFNRGTVKINIGKSIPVSEFELNDLIKKSQEIVEELQRLN
jgi:1-acyl-sn-glycerol-3-phosphate acyltransferase